MSEIRGQVGVSLSDQYDVAGSVAGVKELLDKDVHVVHEMGAVMMAERLSGRMVIMNSAAETQSEDFDVLLNLGPAVQRLLGLQVFVNTAARLTRVQVSITSTIDLLFNPSLTDLPIFLWDGGTEIACRVVRAGSAISPTLLQPDFAPALPNLMIGTDQRASTPQLSMRGRTSAFGAGTVVVTCVAYVAFADVEGLSSFGVPIPGW